MKSLAFMLGLFGLVLMAPSIQATPVTWKPPVAKPNPVHGRQIYFKWCVWCHGRTGKGDGTAGRALPTTPANFTNKAFMTSEEDSDFFKVISFGGGIEPDLTPLMPSFGNTLKAQDIHDVLAWLRTFCKCKYQGK